MAVTIRDVAFPLNPARFSDRYKIEITFEAPVALPGDLEWKLIFVSSPGDEALDQELDDCIVGPVPDGVNKFEFDCDPPDPLRIPDEDVLGVAALILTGSYKDQEFVRVGYYQNTEYDNEEMKENPPAKIMYDRLVRDISTKPRVTRFHIKWDVAPPEPAGVALGAANSASVPSADDIGNDDEQMEVDNKPNGTS